MAQTMHIMSFGPVFLVMAYLYPLCTLIALILPIRMSYMISIYKKHKYKFKKTRTNGPNDAIHVVWAIQWIFIFLIVFFYILTIIVKLQRLRLYGGPLRSLRRGKRAQTTRFASFGPLVRAFFFESCFFPLPIHIYKTIGTMVLRKDPHEATTRRTGPNDAYRVVWAISTCFFKIFVFLLYIYSYPQLL